MRYPFTPYKIDGEFGDKRSYGYHSGVDMNGLEGGNTDCGTRLHAIADAEVVHTSNKNTGYGNIWVAKISGPWGQRWIRYCHLQDVLQDAGAATENVPVATMGSTGNSTACHLHFDIIKVPLPDWRMYAKNKKELEAYFEDPLEFIKTWSNVDAEKPDECVDKLAKSERQLEEVRVKYQTAQEEISLYLEMNNSLQKLNNKLEEQIKLLKSEQPINWKAKLSSRKFISMIGAVLVTASSALSGQVEWNIALQGILAAVIAYMAAEGFIDGMQGRN